MALANWFKTIIKLLVSSYWLTESGRRRAEAENFAVSAIAFVTLPIARIPNRDVPNRTCLARSRAQCLLQPDFKCAAQFCATAIAHFRFQILGSHCLN